MAKISSWEGLPHSYKSAPQPSVRRKKLASSTPTAVKSAGAAAKKPARPTTKSKIKVVTKPPAKADSKKTAAKAGSKPATKAAGKAVAKPPSKAVVATTRTKPADMSRKRAAAASTGKRTTVADAVSKSRKTTQGVEGKGAVSSLRKSSATTKINSAKALRKTASTSVALTASDASQILGEPFAKDALPSIRIFQIYYLPEQRIALDPAFEPYDNTAESSPLLEFGVFTKLAQRTDLRDAGLWGALSWKFAQKTGLSGEDFKRQIVANPGYDVYFCNPHAETEALYHNLWLQGETAHPNFLVLCKEVFEVAGLPAALLTEIQPSAEFASANLFVATPAFWERYISFVARVLVAADRKLSPTTRAILYSSAADQKGVHANATYIPFLIERLFSIFLCTEGSRFKAYKTSLRGQAAAGNAHLKLLGEMKDVAHRTKSFWMAACWVNYRNLYLSKLHGNTWSKKYLKNITPSAIAFSANGTKIASAVAK
jgi:hypothetical protein